MNTIVLACVDQLALVVVLSIGVAAGVACLAVLASLFFGGQ